jgi:acyl-coenzyme A synthetase/AMP-(fatty) acid ligase
MVYRLGWITGHSYILYGPLLNGATGNFRRRSVLSFSRFGKIEKHKVTQFYTHQQPLELWQRKHRICTKLPIDFFESDWISGRTHQ